MTWFPWSAWWDLFTSDPSDRWAIPKFVAIVTAMGLKDLIKLCLLMRKERNERSCRSL